MTATLPGGATRIDDVYLDGQSKSQTGTAVVASYSGYTVNSSPGTVTRQVNFGTSTSTALVKVTTDWLGRAITEVKPGWSGSDVTKTWVYDTYYGFLNKVTQPGLADLLFSYDTMGNLFRECLDVSGNGSIDLASADRITEHGWGFVTASSNWWRRQTTTTYATTGSATATQIAKVEQQLSGLATNRLSRTESYDIFGNVTSQFVDVNRAGKLVTTTTDVPDSTTDAVQIAYNQLLMSSRDPASITMTYGYDALGRSVTAVDPRTGTTTTAYVTGTSQVSTVTDPASIVQATYTYDSAGRVSSVKDALNKYSYTSYTNRNEVYRQWGDTTYPVENGYDNWGRRTTMKTYRGGSGWTSSTWPASPGTADTTTWAYQEATGLLSSKTDAASEAVSYTYTQAGQIDVRTWARGVTTDYGYSSTTGELLTVDYSDSTPDLTYTYNRLGSMATVVDTTGTRTFNYNLAGTLELQNEDLPSFFGSRRVTYPRATSGVIGRQTGLQLGTSGSPTSEQNVTWGYDTYGRFNSLAGGGTTLAFSYTPNSHLLSSISDSVSGWTQTRTYLANRDLLDVIETKVSTTTKGKFDYAHDNLGRRTAVAKTGELYARYGNGTQGLDTTWGYDDRSQLTGEVTKLGGSGTVLTGRDDAYAFDNIGNRASTAGTTHNSNTASYTTNALNQYTQRTVPGVFDVAGAAGSGTTVTVNGSSSGVTRHGEYFFKGQSLSNNPNAVFSVLAVSDGTTTTNVPAFLAGTPEAFSYDDDGQLLSDGRWDYTWNGESQLVAVQTHTALSPSPLPNADARRVEFKYDYLGRRVQKTVRAGWNGSGFTTVVSDEKFVHHGQAIIAKLDAASGNAMVASYYWGLDWSGTLQGAGGVGGLALTVEGGSTYLPMFDGNGNKMGSIKASNGTLASAFEYDAFGNTIRESGPYAASDPFRFSTKYTDIETGLIYYGLRYYSPTLGRFLNKDPIEEQGGLNLYGFCLNSGVNRWDYLGIDPVYLDESYSMTADGRVYYDYGRVNSYMTPRGSSGYQQLGAGFAQNNQGWGQISGLDQFIHDQVLAAQMSSGPGLLDGSNNVASNLISNVLRSAAGIVESALGGIGNSLEGLNDGNLNVLNPTSASFALYQVAAGAVTSVRIAGGIASSVASADAFLSGQVANDGSQVHYVNGVRTSFQDATDAAAIVEARTGQTTQLVYNPTAGPLDLVQAVFEGLGAISPQSLNIADMINGGANDWVGFSQGTRVIAGGIISANPSARVNVNFQGFGGQTFISADTYGINSATNLTSTRDVVSSPYSPVFWAQPSNVATILLSNENRTITPEFRDTFDHQFRNYSQYIQPFPPPHP